MCVKHKSLAKQIMNERNESLVQEQVRAVKTGNESLGSEEPAKSILLESKFQ